MTTKKKPALSTQLKTALAEVDALKKKLSDAERMSKYHSDAQSVATAELQQVHAFLDAVPNAPARKIAGDYGSEIPVSLMSRLAIYLSARSA